MGHYILVEKDAKYMEKWWKWLTITFLALVIVTCFLSTNGFAALLHSFNYNCISGSSVAFVRIPETDAAQSPDASRSINLSGRAINETARDFHLYYLPKAERQIDENNSQWGDTCSYYYYYPVIELTAAVLWIVLLAISGPRRNDTGFYIHKSWRLVIPSMICFCAMAISCAVYAAYLNNSLNSFCTELRKPFSNSELPCRLLIDRFRLIDDTLLTASMNFRMLKSAAFARLVLWLAAAILMLLRCILMADFHKLEATHGQQPRHSAGDAAVDNNTTRVSFIADGVRHGSQEQVYNATTLQL